MPSKTRPAAAPAQNRGPAQSRTVAVHQAKISLFIMVSALTHTFFEVNPPEFVAVVCRVS